MRRGARIGARFLSVGLLMAMPGCVVGQGTQAGSLLFADDFERGLEGWIVPFGQGHALVDTGSDRGRALELRVDDVPVYALIDGSESWEGVRLEGDVMFPEDVHNYLGFIWRYEDDGRRIDFPSVYIKGNGSYLQANPHHDTNVGRTLHPEMRVDLVGARAIAIGEWTRFALEVVGGDAHLYVGDMTAPGMTLRLDAATQGAFGFKPRNPGGRVLIDDVRAVVIDRLSYTGPAVPAFDYRPERYLTDWSVLGPLQGHIQEVESADTIDRGASARDEGRQVSWRPYATDHRGAVFTGAVTEFRGGRRVAYFHTMLESPAERDAVLVFSTIDDIAIWVNGVFEGFGSRQGAAWWDAAWNEERPRVRAPVRLREGRNDLVVRVVGGAYATGGFYAALLEDPPG